MATWRSRRSTAKRYSQCRVDRHAGREVRQGAGNLQQHRGLPHALIPLAAAGGREASADCEARRDECH
eukprot:7969928-Pyramimonas_sp.AAC.1